MNQLDPQDGAYSSRKFWISIGCLIIVLIAGIMSALWASFQPGLQPVINGTIAILGLYLGTNVTSRYITGKHLVDKASIEIKNNNDNSNEPSSVNPENK